MHRSSASVLFLLAGAGLATDVYLPKDPDGPFPLIFVKTPYDFNRIEGARLEWGIAATVHHSPRHPRRIVLPVVRSAD